VDEIPAGAGTAISGYAAQASAAPGQSVDLHVSAPPGARYRVLVYRLGWYGGVGGRLIMCVPGCGSSHAAIAQPSPAKPDPVTGLFRAPWRVTDRVEVPAGAVSGYYEAKLEIVGGPDAGAVGSVPLIGRQSPAAPASAVLVPARDRRLDNGFFSAFGEPECQLMGVEHQWAAQRDLSAPPTAYTVAGPASDPWLAAAGLAPGEVIPGVVGYEWDSLVPGCFAGRVVPLMTAVVAGSDGVRHRVDMIRATAPGGGRVFAMGTMELAWALDDLDGRVPNPRLAAFVMAALRDLTRPAAGNAAS
jgi:hypothetical protein